jgi:hypothetical protein
MAGLKQPLREGEDGFVDDPILGGVAGIVVRCKYIQSLAPYLFANGGRPPFVEHTG